MRTYHTIGMCPVSRRRVDDIITTDDNGQVISVRPRVGQEAGFHITNSFQFPSDTKALAYLYGETVAPVPRSALDVSSDIIAVIEVSGRWEKYS